MASPQGSTEKRGGSYAIHAEIGAGGMATVHLGQLLGARGFARTVAIKVLHASYARNETFVARFLDEARLVARIHHPNVMPTLDVFTEGDELRIVMEYVAGESLDRLEARAREKGERVPARVACAIIAGALHGLHAAHEAKNEFGEPLGIIHLDVSPQNILVGQDGTTRVLDFGVARAKGGHVEAAGGGKSAYLAPEQVTGAEVSPRTDIFAASVVLWELLTGEPLFAADNHAATMQRVLGAVIPPTLEKVPELPARLDEVLRTGLQREPARRYATARQMALELERTVAPALPSEVGRWVESVAKETLLARAAQVQEMEAGSARRTPALPGLVPTRDLYEEQAAVNLPPEELEDADSSALLRPPGGSDPLVPERAPDGSVRWIPRQRKALAPAAPTAAAPGAAASRRPAAVSARPAAVSAGPATASADPAAPPVEEPRRQRRYVLWLALAGVVVMAGIVALLARVFVWPGYVRGTIIAEAAAHGVTLTVGDASLADDGVLLHDLTARLAGVPQMRGVIASASVHTTGSSPTKVVLGKTEVTVDGDVREVFAALSRWSSAHLGAGRRSDDDSPGVSVDVPNAHARLDPTGRAGRDAPRCGEREGEPRLAGVGRRGAPPLQHAGPGDARRHLRPLERERRPHDQGDARPPRLRPRGARRRERAARRRRHGRRVVRARHPSHRDRSARDPAHGARGRRGAPPAGRGRGALRRAQPRADHRLAPGRGLRGPRARARGARSTPTCPAKSRASRAAR